MFKLLANNITQYHIQKKAQLYIKKNHNFFPNKKEKFPFGLEMIIEKVKIFYSRCVESKLFVGENIMFKVKK